MEEQYLSQFTNRNLKGALLQRTNIAPLEELLNTKGKRLVRLQGLKKRDELYFGNRLSRNKVGQTFLQVKDEVDRFLGVRRVDVPKLKYGISTGEFISLTSRLLCGGLYIGHAGLNSMFGNQTTHNVSYSANDIASIVISSLLAGAIPGLVTVNEAKKEVN